MGSDEKLVELCLQGEEHLFDVLVKRYADHIFNFIHQYIKDEGKAEDLTQDVFFRVWKHLKKFDTKRKFKVWIFQIARNAVIDYLRKRKELKFSDLETDDGENAIMDIKDEGENMNDALERKETKEEVERILQELSPAHRSVLILHYQDDLNFREIAEVTGASENTVRSRHRRALATLKTKLEAENAPKL